MPGLDPGSIDLRNKGFLSKKIDHGVI